MKSKGKSIAVVGCGWLGIPFSQIMIENNWTVHGTTTRESKLLQLKRIGIVPYLLSLPLKDVLDPQLLKVDFLLINLPPGRRNSNVLTDYPEAIIQLINSAREVGFIRKIIFVSSTSVYGSSEELIDEYTVPQPESDSGTALLKAEKLISESRISCVILRFGGLAGPGRHPGKFLAGRTGITSGNQSINYLHLEDAIGVIKLVVEHSVENEVFNIVAPVHPIKSAFYKKMAQDIGLEPPTFVKTTDQFRREISVNKFLLQTRYHFLNPDPMTFKY